MNIFKGVVFFIGLFVLSRLIPHAPNFTPIIASVIFLPFIIKSKFGLGLPILVMLISDLIIGFHSAMFWVYGAFILIGLMAYIFYRPSFSRVLSLAIIMDANKYFYILLIVVILQLFYQIRTFKKDNPTSCLKVFKSNNYVGLVVFLCMGTFSFL
mgnify:CR=1 FL=1